MRELLTVTLACADRQANPGYAPTVTDGFGYPYIKGAGDFD
jgi:hypothetical protein